MFPLCALRRFPFILALGVLALGACRTTTTVSPATAFGLTLGAILDKTTVPPMEALIAGRAMYRVRPPSPHRALSEYAVFADRDSGKMIGIVGWDRYSDGSACAREREALDEALKRRFGPGKPVAATDREQMRGLPDSLNASELTIYPGYQGPVALGCSGPRLLLGYWFVAPDAPPSASDPSPKPAPSGQSSGTQPPGKP